MTKDGADSGFDQITPRAQNRATVDLDLDDDLDPALSAKQMKPRVAFASETTQISEEGEKEQSSSNPQDPTLGNEPSSHPSHASQSGHNIITPEKASKPTENRRQTRRNMSKKRANTAWKKRKRSGRSSRIASFHDAQQDSHGFPALPDNQFSATLRRRAIRKQDTSQEEALSSSGEEEYGDISLGMKLIVAGGRVIVQSLNALSDGRASPAQLAGVIQRGDILLAIGNLSLVQLPIDQLMEGLKPLSTPETADGKYRRFLKLRFEAGTGHDLLKSHEEGTQWKTSDANAAAGSGSSPEMKSTLDPANDMFTLFPMVDQLGGSPILEEHVVQQPQEEKGETKENESENDEDESVPPEDQKDAEDSVDDEQAEASPDDLMSAVLAKQQSLDRERFLSDFFNWKDSLPELLRNSKVEPADEKAITDAGMTPAERVELGISGMSLAKRLATRMEDIDKGKDMRSFKTWSTNFSLRSGASARRRHVMDTVSLVSNRNQDSGDSTDESVGSADGSSLDGVDGDALLLGLAAHDGIWRKQVIEALQTAKEELESTTEQQDTQEEAPQATEDIDTALTKQLGTFLFGENMNRIITHKTKSNALPPEEITTVLFDLTTHVNSSDPDEITIYGGGVSNNSSFQSSFGPQGRTKAQLRADMLLANRFLLDEALPVWLESFKPLGLEQRRVFWPSMRNNLTGSHAGTNTLHSDLDSITVDSAGTDAKAGSKTKNLQETIEDQELDVETRAETCFLVSYYFKQKILIQYKNRDPTTPVPHVDEEVATFVRKFGTYLQIHGCFSFSAMVRADTAIDELLKVARYDPSHREAVKEIHAADSLTFYDASKLSALLEGLREVRFESQERRRNVIKNMCVSAFPDVQPWQVRRACLEEPPAFLDTSSKTACSPECLQDWYYSYLSLLLDPAQGQEAAKQNASLVEEWCQWSIGISQPGIVQGTSENQLLNFYRVASRASSEHLEYCRDLAKLLGMCMTIKEYDLALDLAGEIVETRKFASKHDTMRRVMSCLRDIGRYALGLAIEPPQEADGFHLLKRVLRIFNQIATSDNEACRSSIAVADELHSFLVEWKRPNSGADDSQMLVLIDFMISESAPQDVLGALVLWTSSHELGPALFARLDTLLSRGVEAALKSELSGSLLRLKVMRQRYTTSNKAMQLSRQVSRTSEQPKDIWRQMSIGALMIDK